MSANLGGALFTASVSVCVGGLVSYLLYVKTIGKWYAKDRSESKHAKIKYWCGILSLLTITQGVITIANELINSIVNNVAINVDNLARGVVVVVIYPILFAVIALVLSFFIKEKTNEETVQRVEKTDSVIKNTNTNTNNSKLIIFLVIAVVVLLVIQIAPYLKTNEKEKTFIVESCITCKNNDCKPSFDLIKFRVTPKIVYIHYKSDGEEKINIYPETTSDLCVVAKNANFSFYCEKTRDFGLTKLESTNEFDGESTYKSETKATFMQEAVVTKNICQIK